MHIYTSLRLDSSAYSYCTLTLSNVNSSYVQAFLISLAGPVRDLHTWDTLEKRRDTLARIVPRALSFDRYQDFDLLLVREGLRNLSVFLR